MRAAAVGSPRWTRANPSAPALLAPGPFAPRQPLSSTDTVLTGGWDKKLMSWDRRAPTALATTAALPDKAFSMGMDKSR